MHAHTTIPGVAAYESLQRSSIARPLAGSAVHTVIGPEAGQRGPWSLITDTPQSTQDMVGPPAIYLAVAAWAACTVVTAVGVAFRRQLPLQNLQVDFQITPAVNTMPGGFQVRKTLTLHGPLDEAAQRRVQRVAAYCPVSQLWTKGALEIEEQVRSHAELPVAEQPLSTAREVLPCRVVSPPCAPGTVSSQYLLETKTYDAQGSLHQEGEVKIALACANRTRPGRWTLLAGHSEEGWVPAPVPLAYAAVAASTVTTLQHAIPREAWPAGGFQVEMAPYTAGNRDQAQANAATGTFSPRRVVRTVVVYGDVNAWLRQAIAVAVQQDPLTASVRAGTVVLDTNVVVV